MLEIVVVLAVLACTRAVTTLAEALAQRWILVARAELARADPPSSEVASRSVAQSGDAS